MEIDRQKTLPSGNTEKNENNPRINSLKEVGEITVLKPVGNIHCQVIIGQIEGHQMLPSPAKATKYEHIIPQLFAAEENPHIKGILVILNTSGGDVEAGLAIAELLASMSKPTVSLVLGGGHSIGVPIAVSCSRSFIAPTATMTLHPVRYTGLVINGHQQFEYLQKMQDRITGFICSHSRIKIEMLNELMFRTGELAQDIGTILIGKEAVEAGLIDEVGGLKEACQCLKRMFKK